MLASGSVCGTVLLWCKEEAGAGKREGWVQVAKLELALQVGRGGLRCHAGPGDEHGGCAGGASEQVRLKDYR